MKGKLLLAFGVLVAAGAIIGTASLTGLTSLGGLTSLAAQEADEEEHAVVTFGDGGGYLGVYLEDVDDEAALACDACAEIIEGAVGEDLAVTESGFTHPTDVFCTDITRSLCQLFSIGQG